MHKTKRTNKHFKKTRKVRKKLYKKSKYNYCKKGMTDEAIRILNLIKEAKKLQLKNKKNNTENVTENKSNDQ
jgi:pentatricopeptide repeat protein